MQDVLLVLGLLSAIWLHRREGSNIAELNRSGFPELIAKMYGFLRIEVRAQPVPTAADSEPGRGARTRARPPGAPAEVTPGAVLPSVKTAPPLGQRRGLVDAQAVGGEAPRI